MGKYSAQGWQYWPHQREGQYRIRELNISPYCPTRGSAMIDLLYDWVNNKVATTHSRLGTEINSLVCASTS